MSNSEIKDARPDLAVLTLFTESGAKFLLIYRVWILAAVWLLARGYAIWGLIPDDVVASYFQIAGDWLDGFTPYAAFKVEYPPGALLLFVLPRIFTESLIGYGYIFAVVMLLADLGVLVLLQRIAARVSGRDADIDTAQRFQSVWLGFVYLLFTTLFGRLLLQRFDLVVALLLCAVIYAALRKKPVLVDVLLAVGLGLNLAVIAWIPLLWWHGLVGGNAALPAKSLLRSRKFWHILLRRIAVLAGSLTVFILPFFLLSGSSLGYIIKFHFETGLQLESTAAGILIVIAKIFGLELATEVAHQATYLTGVPGEQAATVSSILSIVLWALITIYTARKIYSHRDQTAVSLWLIRGLLATILGLLATSKVFMPHYLLWIAPLSALLTQVERLRVSTAGWRLLAVNLLTLALFFFFSAELEKLQLLPAVILLLRNGLVIWIVFTLLAPETATADSPKPGYGLPLYGNSYLTQIATILLFVWGTIAAFCPVSSNDLWLLLKEAGDIVASGSVPRFEQYSAVAFGRPYLAHEWLSGLVFLGIFNLGGGEALTVFRASVMLAMLLLLWYSLEKGNRRFMIAAPLLALAAYTILIRVFVRPHIFTHLFLCVWVFSLEHWRRERRPGYLILLVPLQILWANLHGGYIFAPVLGALMTGAIAVLVVFPGWSKYESYTWSDVRTLALLTAACLAVSLVNPNGPRLLEFSLSIGLGSDYIKQAVFEWASPLGARYAQSYGREAAIGMILLVWLGLGANIKPRPFVDAAIALLATLISLQAIRFLSFIGILGFPIAVRAWRAAADTYINRPPLARRPLVEIFFFGLLLSSTLTYGFPYGATKHRQVGWGLGGRMPYQETAYIKEQGLAGAIFNDYGDGAFLIYHLSPKVRPVMDSRIDVYGRQLYQEYSASRDNPITFFKYLNRYKVSLILLRKSQQNLQINQYLNYIPATKLLLETDRRYLFAYDPELLPPEMLQQ